MSTFTTYAIVAVVAFACGYWIGWNRSAHPGKVAGEASGLWAKIKAKLHL